MSTKQSIRFYKDREVRAVWSDEQNKWFFSIVDIVAAITESPRPRVYWGTVKNRQKAQYGELYSKCIQLKLLSVDGKRYATDCFAQEDIIEVVKTLPTKNTTAFLDWFTYSDNSIDGQSRKKAYTFWATQKAMATLFDCSTDNIGVHLKNIFESGELDKDSVTEKISATAADGKNYLTQFYKLDAIISVGYRVNSIRATQFRQWCTAVLRQFAIRGYVIDKKRMENGAFISEDYFEHLLAEIREIRLSERRFYQKLTDIYATAIDYNLDAPTTREFFAKVQNKMHYAVHGQTAAELIVSRANAEKEHMGLTTWEKAPNGKIVKPDVSVAKNYLNELELEDMGRLVNSVLDTAERMAKRHIPMTMEDWAKRIDIILEASDDRILTNAGSVSAEQAKEYAETEFEKYRIIQDRLFESDFDRFELPTLPFDKQE